MEVEVRRTKDGVNANDFSEKRRPEQNNDRRGHEEDRRAAFDCSV